MGSKLSSISPSSDSSYFIPKNTCSCSTKYWKSFQMDLNIASMILLHHSYETSAKIEQEIVTVYFRYSNCEAEFPLAMYYFDGEFYRNYGIFKRMLTSNDRVSTVFPHDSLKNILFILSQSKKIYTSENYAIDLFKALLQFEYM